MYIKTKFFLLISLIFFFINSTIIADDNRNLSMEEQREKALGLKRAESDSKSVIVQNIIRDIEMGNIDNLKIYIKNTTNNSLNSMTSKGLTPLVHAANVNNIQIIKLFLTKTKVDINIEDQLGNTALIKAAEKGYIEIVDYLINNGADINYQNKDGMTAAMKSAEKNHFYVLKILIENNADIERTDFTGRTLKEITKNSRDKRMIKLLN